jgi:uncharacterized protein YjdB
MNRIRIAKLVFLHLLMAVSFCTNAVTRYVKPAATGSGNGSSWANASADLQAMINASSAGDQVWVAAGSYLPKEDASGNSNPSDARTRTFHLSEGINIYGGFAGGEASLAARNLPANVTVLSGDLGIANSTSDNAYHVVTSSLPGAGSQGCTLDGFMIKYGNANGGINQNIGGGVYIYRGTGVVLRNLNITANSASANGGGIYAEQAGISIIQDSVYNNSVGGGGIGGGIHIYAADAFIDSCTVYANTAGTGGGIGFSGSGGTVSHCSIFSNTASGSVGGGLYISSSGSTYCTNNSIYNNTANNYWGGGIFYEGGNFGVFYAWSNSLFGNTAEKGAAVYHNDGTGNYSNNTIFNNAASIDCGGISKLGGTVNLKNNAFWLNKKNNSSTASGVDFVAGGFSANTFYNNSFQLPATSYSLGASASGNLFNTDPLFVNANQPLGIDNIARTSDDGLALSPCSPLINSGMTINPSIATDILGNGRVGNYDIGAYEYQGPPLIIVGTIAGDSIICLNSTVTLSNSIAGGTWSSSNTAVATVSATGQVTGIATGTTIISYRTGTTNCPGTVATRNVTVTTSSMPAPITGSDTACTTRSISLGNAVAGGVWSSSNNAIGTVSNAGVVTGIASGIVTISYRTGGTGCSNTVTKNIVVIPSPTVNAITGDYWVCMYGIPQYASTTPGGVWSTASNGTRSTISAAGVLTPASTGVDTVIYTVTNANGCFQSAKMQINIVTIPAAFNNLSGPGSVCAGKTIQLSNGLFGGAWSSANTAVATVSAQGIVTGISAGSATIIYTYTNPSYGCTAVTTRVITVNAFTGAGTISGNNFVCMNGSLQLSNTISGGTWSTKSGGVKSTINATGLVLPVTAGTIDTVRYIVTNSAGCTDTAYKIINVGANPIVSNIQGADSICANTTTLLINSTPNGTWSSGNTSIATVGTNGMVTGLIQGLVTINYTITNPLGCSTSISKNMYVKAAPAVNNITGAASICVNSSGQYHNSTPGGLWAVASNGSISSISASGMLTAHAAGTDTIRYTITNSTGCAAVAELIVTVNAPLLSPITGPDSLCVGSAVSLSHTVTGGIWTNYAATTGSVSGIGNYSALIPGTDTVYYQYVSNGCPASVKKTLTVVQQDAAMITGLANICKGSTQLLSPSIGGGIWSSNNSAVARVSNNGQVSGISGGTAGIIYTITNALGCSSAATHNITVTAPAVTTSQNGAVLTATGNQNNATYQWVDCGRNFQPLSGAQSAVYTTLSNGQYAVVVTFQGCRDTSACLTVSSVGVAPVAGENAITVSYPGNGQIIVNTGDLVPASMKLYDIQGKLIRSVSTDKTKNIIDASDLAKGVYIIHVYFQHKRVAIRIDM